MTTIPMDIVPGKADRALGLAVAAWERCCASVGRKFALPSAVVSLKPQRVGRKSGVCRLEGAGVGGSSVIAKRCLRSAAAVERAVHERLLPRIDIPTVQYYGHFEEPEGEFCWLFMEDAGATKLFENDRELVAEWLARLHGSAAALAEEITLPERGAAHYHKHLSAAYATLVETTRQPSLAPADQELLRVLQQSIEQLDAKWEETCAPCAGAPRTLVHADFGRKNVRIRDGATGRREVVALDWEMAGWGPPSVDIPHSPRRAPPRKIRNGPAHWRGTIPLEAYAAHAGGRWDGAAFEELTRIARVGSVFRTVASIRWALEQLRAGATDKAMAKLRWYTEDLPHTLAAIDWVK